MYPKVMALAIFSVALAICGVALMVIINKVPCKPFILNLPWQFIEGNKLQKTHPWKFIVSA